MEETRVSKYQEYRASINKEGAKGFRAPKNTKEVSKEMGLFLKNERIRNIENLSIVAIMLTILVLLVVYGVILF